MGNEPAPAGLIGRTGHRVAGIARRRPLPIIALAVVALPAVIGQFADSDYWNALLIVTFAIAVLVAISIMLRRAAR